MKVNLQKTNDQLTHNAHFLERGFLLIAPCVGGLFVLYIALLGINLSNVLERSQTLGKISTFKRDHAEVEQKYLSLVENLDRAKAQEMFGLVEIKDVYFATESSFAVGYSNLSHHVR